MPYSSSPTTMVILMVIRNVWWWIMGEVIYLKEKRRYLSTIELESGNHIMWVDKTINNILDRI